MKSPDFMVVFLCTPSEGTASTCSFWVLLDYLASCLLNSEFIILRYMGLRKGYCLFLMYVKFIEKWVEKDEI